MSETAALCPPRAGPANVKIALAVLLLLLVAAAGIALVLRFVEGERERDLRAWQQRLGIVADSRFAAVDEWLTEQIGEVAALARNASLQLYMSELALAGGDPERAALAEAQAGYLRNLLLVSAERAGFAAPPTGPAVAANVERIGVAGLALVDRAGRVLVATPGMPPVTGSLRDFLAGLRPGAGGVMDLFLDAAGRPAMAFAAPVFAIQGDDDADAQVGLVIGVKQVADELYPRLRQPGAATETAVAVLVRGRDGTVEYLSPLPDGTPPLTLKMARDTPDLDAAFALDHPGGFALRRDYRSRGVLVTGRAFAAVPWTLMYTIERAEALADSEARLTRLSVAFVLAIALVAAALVAVWRHASSRRAAAAADAYRDLAQRFEAQRNLLRLVADSQPAGIYILDADGRYRFANAAASRAAGIAVDDMIGKPAPSVLGPALAEPILDLNRHALEHGQPVSRIWRSEDGGALRVVQFEHVPVPAAATTPPGVLVVERDVTEAVSERERRTRILDQLVRTLVGIVDRRDPFAADQSARVARLARAIAAEMGLGPRDIDTAETAGNLLNLGKILVAPEVLTRSGALTETERRQVRDSLAAGAELLQDIEFDGPVADTLRQAQARWDGTGTPPLAGDDILVTARVVAVANAFIGMTSPRARRDALAADPAIETLLGEVGRAFDRGVVAALINHLDKSNRAAAAD